MKKAHRVILQLLVGFFVVQSLIVSEALFARDSRDIVLVLDTSLSMKGFGGQNIFDRVKASVSRYIENEVKDGDRITFISYDTRVRTYPTVLIDDDNDRDIIKKYISMTEAKGDWTFTYQMLGDVFKKADELAKDNDGRQTMIVVMTDGLDDPPPGSTNKRFSLKDIATQYSQRDWWVLLVNFGNLQKDRRISKLKETLQKELKGVTKNIKVIEGGTNPEKAINKEFQQEVGGMEAQRSYPLSPILIGIVLIIIILLLVMFIKRRSGLKVYGRLEYWKTAVLNPYVMTHDFTKHSGREVTIDKGITCNVNVHDLDMDMAVKIVASQDKSGMRMKLQPIGKCEIEYVNRTEGEFLNDGDIFRIANYSFKFFAR